MSESPLRVLVVDDDPEDAEIVRDLLEEAGPGGYVVRAVTSYEEGLRLLDGDRMDVCLVDYRLGARSGVDFIAEASTRAPAVPTILMTGAGGADVDRSAMEAGAVDYLGKSELSPRRLERIIRYAGERARRQRAEARFRALIESSHDLVFILDADGTVNYVSPSLSRLLGFTPEEKIGANAMFEIHPDDRATVEEEFARVSTGDVGEHVRLRPHRVRHKDGRWRLLDTTASNHLKDPSIGGIVLHARDITDRVANEATIRFHMHLLSAVGQAVIATDLEGLVIYWNAAAERMYGWSADEAVGENVVTLTVPESKTPQAAEIMAALQGGRTWTGEFEVRRKDGSTFPALVTNSPIVSEDGVLEGVIGVSSDITEIKEKEWALRERVKELRTLHQATRILGDAERALEDKFAALVDMIPSGWMYPEITKARLALGEREFATDGFKQTEWILTAPVDFGREEPGRLEVVLTEASPERDEGPFLREERYLINDLALLIGEGLKRERLTQMLLEVGDAVSVLAPDGVILYAKPGEAGEIGYTRREMEGQNALDMIHPEDRREVEAMLRKLSQEPGSMRQLQYRAITADGEVRHLESVGRNLIDHPAIIGLVVTTRDVTERHLLEGQLRQSQKLEAVGRLAAGVAHDFNNLLTVIQSHTDLLLMDLEEKGVLEPDAARPEIETIQTAGERAATLTQQLLAFSREQILEPRIIDISEISRDTMRLLERVIGPSVTVESHLMEGLPLIRVDPAQLEHVITNLAINARDAMPRGGVLTLRTRTTRLSAHARVAGPARESGRYVALDVSDTGSGMDAETLSHIFEPFFTTKEKGKGTGLGLAMTYGMVTQSGGLVRVESEPGKGSTFTLCFPAVDGPPEPRGTERGTGAHEEDVQSRRTLVVEDEEAVRTLTTRILENAGMDVLAVETGEQGIAELERGSHFDLVLTDFSLPGVSGRALVDLLRERGGDVPILVMSGYSADSPADRVDLPEGVEFLQKPFTPKTLMQRVREVLGHG